MKQALLEIQHRLTMKEEATKEKSIKNIKEVVNEAMKDWQTKNGGGKVDSRKTGTVGEAQEGTLLIRATLTPELLAVLLQGTQVQNKKNTMKGGLGQGRVMLICYRCGLEGHRADACTNPKNPQLVTQQARLAGAKPCNHCGRYGHASRVC